MNIEQEQQHTNPLLPLPNPKGPQNPKKSSYMESDFIHITRPNPPNDLILGSNALRFFLLDVDTETTRVADSLQEDTVVRLFGITEQGNTVLVRVQDYQCHLTIECNEDLVPNREGEELERLRLELNNQLQMKACLAPDNVIPKLEFYGEKYLKIYFVHPQYLQIFKEEIILKEAGEAFHKPTRRCEDLLAVQFMMEAGIKLMSWVEIEAEEGLNIEKVRTSECQIEARASVNKLKGVISEASPKMRVLVMRTECEYMAKEKGESEGKLRRIMKIRNVYEEIGGEEGPQEVRFDMEEYKNETNMLRDWRRFLLAWDPDVIIGGSEVLEKDIREIYKRAKMLKLNEYVGLGRAESKISALLSQETSTPGLNGRVVIDLLAWVMKEDVVIDDEKLERIQRELSRKDGEMNEMAVLEMFKEMDLLGVLRRKEIEAPLRLMTGRSAVEAEVSLVKKNASEVMRKWNIEKPLVLKAVQIKDENHAEFSLGDQKGASLFEGIIEQPVEENSLIKALDYEVIGEALRIKEAESWNGSPEILKIWSFLSEIGQIDWGALVPKAPVPEPRKDKEDVPKVQNALSNVKKAEKKVEKVQEKVKEKGAKKGGKASSTTERKNGSTIYDFFKVASLKHSNSGHSVGKEEEKTLLKKRSLMEDKDENLEPKIEKNLKVDNGEEFKAIRKMTVNTKRWTIKVRVYGKTTKLQTERKGIWSDYFVAEGMDEDGGEISIVFNEKELVERYYERVIVGEVYVVSGGVLVDKVRRTYKSRNSLQILFMGDCPLRFELQENCENFPGVHYNMKKLGDIKDELLDVDVSVIGMVVRSKLENITKKDKSTVPVRKVTITDQYKDTVELVLWDKLSEIRINLFDVVIVNKAKIRKFNNTKHLGMTQHTQIMTNYFQNYKEIQPFYTFVQKFHADKFGNLARLFPYLDDPAVNLHQIASSRDDYGTYESRVYVSYINKKSLSSYQACPNCRKNLNPSQAFTQGAQVTPSQDYDGNVYKNNVQVYDVGKDMQAQKREKKLKERKEGEILCVYCGSYMEAAETVAIASVKLMDYTETVNASAFGSVAQVINPVEDQDVMETQWQEFRVKMRASLDANSDRKYTIFGVKPVDYREESLDIIGELERLKAGRR